MFARPSGFSVTLRHPLRRRASHVPSNSGGTRCGPSGLLPRTLVRSARSAIFAALLVLLPGHGASFSQDRAALQPYSAAIHVHSTFSNGQYTVMELAELAAERDLDILILTDAFLTTATYGIWPFHRVAWTGLNRVREPSVLDHGIANYFAAIREAQDAFPSVLILPGVEVRPYYYWQGSPFDQLQLYDFDRHFLIFGLNAEQLRHLPVVENATWQNGTLSWTLLGLPLLLLATGVALTRVRITRQVRLKYYRVRRTVRLTGAGVLLCLLGFCLALFNYPYVELYDPYRGSHQIEPFQRVIDYVREHDGAVYWAYPEARYSDVEQGGAKMISEPHPEDLVATDGYHGFEGLYGDWISATEPGGVWDQTLAEYLDGCRQVPPFVITGIDFHSFGDGPGGWYELDHGLTTLLLSEKSETAVLQALKTGRAYATFQSPRDGLRLADFVVTANNGRSGGVGETVAGGSPVEVSLEFSPRTAESAEDVQWRIELIRNGEIVEEFEGRSAFSRSFQHDLSTGRHFYRFRAHSSRREEILSNPIFVTLQ